MLEVIFEDGVTLPLAFGKVDGTARLLNEGCTNLGLNGALLLAGTEPGWETTGLLMAAVFGVGALLLAGVDLTEVTGDS